MSTRRDLLAGFGVAIGSASLPMASQIYHSVTPPKVTFQFGEFGPNVERPLSLTPSAGELSPTMGQTQGPFFAYKSPRRRDIRDTYPGDSTLVLAGYVLDVDGNPLPGCVLDFWQTDETAKYDIAGYRYRGHQFTDRSGRFELITISPRPYAAGGLPRTAHIHAKVQGASTRILTTQLYLPEHSDLNSVDPLFNPSLLMADSETSGTVREMRFDFVLADT